MSELEDKVIEVLGGLLAGTNWKYPPPAGGTGPMNFYSGRVPEASIEDSEGLEGEQLARHGDPFILVREVSGKFTEPQDIAGVFLWLQLYDVTGYGRDELKNLVNLIRPAIRADYYPWAAVEEMELQLGDEYGNQGDPIFIAFIKMNFFKGTGSYG